MYSLHDFWLPKKAEIRLEKVDEHGFQRIKIDCPPPAGYIVFCFDPHDPKQMTIQEFIQKIKALKI